MTNDVGVTTTTSRADTDHHLSTLIAQSKRPALRPKLVPAAPDLIGLFLAVALVVGAIWVSWDSYLIWQIGYPLIALVPVGYFVERLYRYFVQRLVVAGGKFGVHEFRRQPVSFAAPAILRLAVATVLVTRARPLKPVRRWYPVVCIEGRTFGLDFRRSRSLQSTLDELAWIADVFGRADIKNPVGDYLLWDADGQAWTTFENVLGTAAKSRA